MSSSVTGTASGSGGWTPPSVEELQALLPQYELESMLGHGGMGAVYKGKQATLQRPVAIKVLPETLIAGDDDHQYVERFKLEARAMANLDHPAIISVFDFGQTTAGHLYFVMEFIDGMDIEQYIVASGGKVDPDHAVAIVSHVLDALNYAHSKGIVHRDIKPANVLINTEGRVKIADFGLAKEFGGESAELSGLTMTNMAMGTPDYIAPEALEIGQVPDHRADLYAVGVMLYRMLTGKLPRGMFKLPSEEIGGLDQRFDDIIALAMESDPGGRYQSATEFRNQLDDLQTAPVTRMEPQQDSGDVSPAVSMRLLRARKNRETETQGTPEPVPTKTSSKFKPGLIIGISVACVIGVLAFFILNRPDDESQITLSDDGGGSGLASVSSPPVVDTASDIGSVAAASSPWPTGPNYVQAGQFRAWSSQPYDPLIQLDAIAEVEDVQQVRMLMDQWIVLTGSGETWSSNPEYELKNIARIAASDQLHAGLITRDGELIAFDDGYEITASLPDFPRAVVDAYLSPSYGAALLEDGSLITWDNKWPEVPQLRPHERAVALSASAESLTVELDSGKLLAWTKEGRGAVPSEFQTQAVLDFASLQGALYAIRAVDQKAYGRGWTNVNEPADSFSAEQNFVAWDDGEMGVVVLSDQGQVSVNRSFYQALPELKDVLARVRHAKPGLFSIHRVVGTNKQSRLLYFEPSDSDRSKGQPPLELSLPPQAGTFDLISLVDPESDAIRGNWKKEGDSVVRESPNGPANLRLPIPIADNYNLKFTFTHVDENADVIVILPIADRSVQLCLCAFQSNPDGPSAGLSKIDDKITPGNDTAVFGLEFSPDISYLVESRVRTDGETVSIEVDLQGKSLVRWEGSIEGLSNGLPWWKNQIAGYPSMVYLHHATSGATRYSNVVLENLNDGAVSITQGPAAGQGSMGTGATGSGGSSISVPDLSEVHENLKRYRDYRRTRIGDLIVNYRNQLNRKKQEATAAGSLEQVEAANAASEALATYAANLGQMLDEDAIARLPLPRWATPTNGDYASLDRIFRSALNEIESDATLKLDEVLEFSLEELTRQDRIEDAGAVREFRASIISFLASGESVAGGEGWLSLIPEIDTQRDLSPRETIDPKFNIWRKDGGTLVFPPNRRPGEITMPGTEGFTDFELRFNVTRISGDKGFKIFIPTGTGGTPIAFDVDGGRSYMHGVSGQGRAYFEDLKLIDGQETQIAVVARTDPEPSVIVTANGKTVIDSTADYRQLIAERNYSSKRIGFNILGTRPSEPDTHFRFRDIQFRPLTSSQQESAPKVETSEWLSLTNGRDFEGWSGSDLGKWRVEDGGLFSSDANNIFIDHPHREFELEGELYVSPDGNGGVMFLDQVRGGFEFALAGSNTKVNGWGSVYTGGVFEVRRNGIRKSPEKNLIKDNTWTPFRIRATGDQFTTWVDGIEALQYELPSGTSGRRIGLQGGRRAGSKVGYRNLRIRPLESVTSSGDWTSLFNGNDLTGWSKRSGGSRFWVEDGCINGVASRGTPSTFLCTDQEFNNFELEFEVQLAGRLANSGVQIRSKIKPGTEGKFNGTVIGPQVEIEGSPGASGHLFGQGLRGWLGERTPQDHQHMVNASFNRYRVVANGPRIQTWVNGNPVADISRPDLLNNHGTGFIALQVHSLGNSDIPTRISWKNIRIRPLQPD